MQKDKILHGIISCLLVFLFYYFVPILWLAVLLTFIIGIIKELLDINSTGFDIMDLLADIAGIVIAILILKI